MLLAFFYLGFIGLVLYGFIKMLMPPPPDDPHKLKWERQLAENSRREIRDELAIRKHQIDAAIKKADDRES